MRGRNTNPENRVTSKWLGIPAICQLINREGLGIDLLSQMLVICIVGSCSGRLRGPKMTRWRFIPLSATLIVASVAAGSAADRPVLKAPVAPPKVDFGNLFYGVDADSHSSLAGYLGVLYAPYGMHQSGIRLTAFALHGKYEYESFPTDVKGRFWSGDFLVGWSNVVANGAATLSIGANYQDHRLSRNDPSNSVVGSEWGFKVQGDFWVTPMPNWLVVGLASYSTAFDTYYANLRIGYDFTQGRGVYFGPELGALGNDRTDQVRVGAHLSGIKIAAATKLNVSGGWLHERGHGDGWYGTATVDVTF